MEASTALYSCSHPRRSDPGTPGSGVVWGVPLRGAARYRGTGTPGPACIILYILLVPELPQPNTAYPIILDALVARRCAYRSESEAVQEGLDGVHLLQPHSQSDRDARLAELLQLIPPFDRRGRQRDKGLVHMIVEGEKPLPPDLISMIVARAGVP